MINPDHYVDSLNQLLNKIDKTAENSCLNHPGSIELTDFLRKLIEMDSAEAVKHLINRRATDRYR